MVLLWSFQHNTVTFLITKIFLAVCTGAANMSMSVRTTNHYIAAFCLFHEPQHDAQRPCSDSSHVTIRLIKLWFYDLLFYYYRRRSYGVWSCQLTSFHNSSTTHCISSKDRKHYCSIRSISA